MPGRNAPTERTCVVTRQTLPVDALIRFVVAPDGTVVPDLRRRLPGRGVWVTADADHVAKAERKGLLARAFDGPARVEPGLAERVEKLLLAAAIGALSLARKAGSRRRRLRQGRGGAVARSRRRADPRRRSRRRWRGKARFRGPPALRRGRPADHSVADRRGFGFGFWPNKCDTCCAACRAGEHQSAGTDSRSRPVSW